MITVAHVALVVLGVAVFFTALAALILTAPTVPDRDELEAMYPDVTDKDQP